MPSLLWVIFLAVTITTVWKQSESIWPFLLRRLITMLVKAPPSITAHASLAVLPGITAKLITGGTGVATMGTLGLLFLFFAKAGAFVFGSGLAIVPLFYGGVVGHYHWLTERQFVDAVAIAMITPGPIVTTAAFVEYLVGGAVGAVLAVLAVFAPPYFFVLLGAPYYSRFANNPQVKAFVKGVTAAASTQSPEPPTSLRVAC